MCVMATISTIFISFSNRITSNSRKLKTFADDKLNVPLGMIYLPVIVENIVDKGENAGYQQFSFTHNVFTNLLLQAV